MRSLGILWYCYESGVAMRILWCCYEKSEKSENIVVLIILWCCYGKSGNIVVLL